MTPPRKSGVVGIENESGRFAQASCHLVEESWFGIDNATAATAIQVEVHPFVGFVDVIGRSPMGEMHMGDNAERNEPFQCPKHGRSMHVGLVASDGHGYLIGREMRGGGTDDVEHGPSCRRRSLTEISQPLF